MSIQDLFEFSREGLFPGTTAGLVLSSAAVLSSIGIVAYGVWLGLLKGYVRRVRKRAKQLLAQVEGDHPEIGLVRDLVSDDRVEVVGYYACTVQPLGGGPWSLRAAAGVIVGCGGRRAMLTVYWDGEWTLTVFPDAHQTIAYGSFDGPLAYNIAYDMVLWASGDRETIDTPRKVHDAKYDLITTYTTNTERGDKNE